MPDFLNEALVDVDEGQQTQWLICNPYDKQNIVWLNDTLKINSTLHLTRRSNCTILCM